MYLRVFCHLMSWVAILGPASVFLVLALFGNGMLWDIGPLWCAISLILATVFFHGGLCVFRDINTPDP